MDREKVIKGLAHCTRPSEVGKGGNFCMDCPYTEPIGFNQFKCNSQQMMKDALALLKEREDEKKRIMKVIWDILHEGLSIDTVADQDWVYEQIRHRIEDT